MESTPTRFFELKPAESKQEQAYSFIKTAIFKNELTPGTVLVERRVSDQLGLSRMPVREAIKRLVSEGHLATLPGGSVVVPEITLDDILALCELGELMDLFAVRRCINNLTPNVARELEEKQRLMREAIDAGDDYGSQQYDYEFHYTIISQARTARIAPLLAQLNEQRMHLRVTTYGDFDMQLHSWEEHEELRKSILEKDIPRAEAAVRAHFATTRNYHIEKLIRQNT